MPRCLLRIQCLHPRLRPRGGSCGCHEVTRRRPRKPPDLSRAVVKKKKPPGKGPTCPNRGHPVPWARPQRESTETPLGSYCTKGRFVPLRSINVVNDLIPQALVRWDTHDAADAAAGAHPSLNLTSRPPKPLSCRPRGVAAYSLDAEVMMAARPAGAEICPAERRHLRHQARASRHTERRGVRRRRSSYAATRGERGVDGVSLFFVGDPPRTEQFDMASLRPLGPCGRKSRD
jgi:hypothetical protein